MTTKLESELKASITAEIPATKINLSGGESLSQEEKAKVVERAKYVVNQVQIQELSYVLELLDTILEDPKKKYYIVIDRLDENWVEEGVRYLLIRALIETVRDFCKVRHAKIIIALRYDLIDRVIRLSRGPGFQEEKYESLYLNLSWSGEQLTELLDKRIGRMVRQSYTKQLVTHKDLLPKAVDKQPTIDYILDRTLMRPRDMIIFFNACIRQAHDNPTVTSAMLKEAEGEYSRQRLRSLADEWIAEYPELLTMVDVLKNRPARFTVQDITDEQCVNLAIRLLDSKRGTDKELAEALKDIENDPTRTTAFRNWLIVAFYRVSLIGLKLESFETVTWSATGRRTVSAAEIAQTTKVAVHPCFWRSLGINPAPGN